MCNIKKEFLLQAVITDGLGAFLGIIVGGIVLNDSASLNSYQCMVKDILRNCDLNPCSCKTASLAYGKSPDF